MKVGALLGLSLLALSVSLPAQAQSNPELRRKCAALVKAKLGIKNTGHVDDLKGVRGAVQMVDRCVANKGKVE